MSMNDVSKISFSVLNNTKLPQKDVEEKEAKKETLESKAQTAHKDPDSILDALAMSGSQNKLMLGLNSINPADYLTPERIKDIETSMGIFEAGVQKNLNAINAEFKAIPELDSLSDAYKLELAAKMML
ncbi:MAG: hypothetical protein E7Z91_01510 [Cyanobacteria bacterium SIG30]|nr:hypothetical protein [Cyanobacteria bacterium SIG30]